MRNTFYIFTVLTEDVSIKRIITLFLAIKKYRKEMSYKMPLKPAQTKSKWLTAALVCIYILIAAFLFVNI